MQASKPRRPTMSEDERFGAEMQRLTRRVEKLQLLKQGRARVRELAVAGVWVKRHYRKPHTRLLVR